MVLKNAPFPLCDLLMKWKQSLSQQKLPPPSLKKDFCFAPVCAAASEAALLFLPVHSYAFLSSYTQYMSLYISCSSGCREVSSVVLISCTSWACSVTSSRRSANFCSSLGKRKVSSGWLASRWSRSAWTMLSCNCSTTGTSTRPGRSLGAVGEDKIMKKENSNMSFSLLNYYSTTYYRPFTSTADNSSHKKS